MNINIVPSNSNPYVNYHLLNSNKDKIKLCNNCKHFDPEQKICKLFGKINYIDGKINYLSIISARENNEYCGYEGKYYNNK